MFVSFGFRFRVEVEALNMAEAVGNYTRHRVAPVLVLERGENGEVHGYKITMAPAVSGQSIAFGYMSALVKLAPGRELPVCEECKNYEKLGGFFKRADKPEVLHDDRIKSCVVEDLTGFMATKEKGKGGRGLMLRRTSPVMFSYMVPDAVSARGVLVPQLHVRYNLIDPEKQIPYQIEAGTAVYIHGVAIDIERVGKLEQGSFTNEKNKRVELAFDALKALYGGLLFGAKKARYLPIIEALGGIAAVSHPMPFMVTPPRLGDYVSENLKRVEKFGVGAVQLFCFDREGVTSCGKDSNVKVVSSLEELVDEVKRAVLKDLSDKK